MPKTNHNRNFRDERDYTVPGGDFCRGKHGAAKSKRGQKKFRRSRQRFHQNQQVTAMVDEDVSLMPTKHDKVLKGHSKLRMPSGSGRKMLCTQCGKEVTMLMIVVPLEQELCKACKAKLP